MATMLIETTMLTTRPPTTLCAGCCMHYEYLYTDHIRVWLIIYWILFVCYFCCTNLLGDTSRTTKYSYFNIFFCFHVISSCVIHPSVMFVYIVTKRTTSFYGFSPNLCL